eukprot:1594215-Pleurochrysis_carterae.AAC.1
MILRVDVLVAKISIRRKDRQQGSLRSTQQRVAVTQAPVPCYHPPTAGVPPRPGVPRAWLKRRRFR